MKKLLLFAAVAVFGLWNVNAQTEKGNWMFGADANVSFSSNTAKQEYNGNESEGKETISIFTFTPSANYFVINN